MATSQTVRSNVTCILAAVHAGEDDAYDRFLTLIYSELRKLAARQLHCERDGHRLQPAALVNKACERLIADEDREDRAHFLGAAAKAMRRVLVDHARTRHVRKCDDNDRRLTVFGLPSEPNSFEIDVLDLEQALEELEKENKTLALIVQLKYFGGLTQEDIAMSLNLGSETVMRDWLYARAWLHSRLG